MTSVAFDGPPGDSAAAGRAAACERLLEVAEREEPRAAAVDRTEEGVELLAGHLAVAVAVGRVEEHHARRRGQGVRREVEVGGGQRRRRGRGRAGRSRRRRRRTRPRRSAVAVAVEPRRVAPSRTGSAPRPCGTSRRSARAGSPGGCRRAWRPTRGGPARPFRVRRRRLAGDPARRPSRSGRGSNRPRGTPRSGGRPGRRIGMDGRGPRERLPEDANDGLPAPIGTASRGRPLMLSLQTEAGGLGHPVEERGLGHMVNDLGDLVVGITLREGPRCRRR